MAYPPKERMAWYANRLKAMSVPEIAWRIGQKSLQISEKRKFGRRISVADRLLYPDLRKFTTSQKGMLSVEHTNLLALKFYPAIPNLPKMPSGAPPTKAEGGDWKSVWAYSFEYRQREDKGDARIAWEKHRHYTWPRLAYHYTRTGNLSTLDRLTEAFSKWNRKNPFLYGIAWVSPMEVAIRAIQWLFTAANLPTEGKRDNAAVKRLREKLLTGAANMLSYVERHRSRYSSANNHLLIELTSLAIGGVCLRNENWVETALTELESEYPRQFSTDGVNLESSLHYHAFAAEAYMYTMFILGRAGRTVPGKLRNAIRKMARFVQASMATENIPLEFGDFDGGKLMDLTGEGFEYYRYFLQMASILDEDTRYTSFDTVEATIAHIFYPDDIKKTAAKPLNLITDCASFDAAIRSESHTGQGYTFLRSTDGSVLIGIDHSQFGFGSIAAHAHSDMLSFQLFDSGLPVFTDGGTYTYHINLSDRDMRRSELMHNTVCLDGHPQGEMRGAFLWGKRGTARAEKIEKRDETYTVECRATMADGTALERKFSFNTETCSLTITDSDLSNGDITTFLTTQPVDIAPDKKSASVGDWILTTEDGLLSAEQTKIAPEFGKLTPATAIRLTGRTGASSVTIALAGDEE
ncbi:MAG: hypothetical protein HDS68_08560 [Bacteroidales bacterium]|nr:hypothetical protein [Bacteroidales bacterium]